MNNDLTFLKLFDDALGQRGIAVPGVGRQDGCSVLKIPELELLAVDGSSLWFKGYQEPLRVVWRRHARLPRKKR